MSQGALKLDTVYSVHLLLLLVRTPPCARLCSSGAPLSDALMVSGRSALGCCMRCLSRASMMIQHTLVKARRDCDRRCPAEFGNCATVGDAVIG